MKHNTSGTEHKKGTICLCTHCSNTSHLSWVRPWADLNEKEKSPLVSMREDPCTTGKARASCIVSRLPEPTTISGQSLWPSNQTLLHFLELAQLDWGLETQHSVPGQGYAITSTPIGVFPLYQAEKNRGQSSFLCNMKRSMVAQPYWYASTLHTPDFIWVTICPCIHNGLCSTQLNSSPLSV